MPKPCRRFHATAFFLIVFASNFLFFSTLGLVEEGGGFEEEFTEELLLKPLSDRKVVAHFHFQSSAPPAAANGRHHHLFPKAIAQLLFEENKWYSFDDSHVFLINEEEVKSTAAYVLFYRRVRTDNPSPSNGAQSCANQNLS